MILQRRLSSRAADNTWRTLQWFGRDTAKFSSEFVPVLGTHMGLAENAPQGADWHLLLLGYDRGVEGVACASREFNVATLLAHFDESSGLKAALDLTERLRLKPPQPRPRSYEPGVLL